MSTPASTRNVEPQRIGICGGSSIDGTTAAFCHELGRALAQREGAVLVSGGCKRRRDGENFSVDS